jgi:hypothetical protein
MTSPSNILTLPTASALQTEDITLAFLQLVLPKGGPYVWAFKTKSGKFDNGFAADVKDLRDRIIEDDRSGKDVWFALASFKEARKDRPASRKKKYGRTQANVQALRALWLDLDVGPDKHYANAAEAVNAVVGFAKAVNLPRPILVQSGGGIHAYWLLPFEMDISDWTETARGLQALLNRHEVAVDPKRTCDAASVMRVPNTTNKKERTPRPVILAPRFLDNPQPLTAEQIERLQKIPRGSLENRKTLTGSESEIDNDILCSPQNVAFVERGLAKVPSDDYDIWFKVCGVLRDLNWGDEGERIAREWSAKASNWDEDAFATLWNEGLTRGYVGTRTRMGTLIQMIRAHGFHEVPPWHYVESADEDEWELTAKGALRSNSYRNAMKALKELGAEYRHDVFHDVKYIEGGGVEAQGPQLSDKITRALHEATARKWETDFGQRHIQEAAELLCEANRFNPIVDYLDALKWDGKHRIDTWLNVYCGAEDTELNRAIGRKFLCAMVRRARRPGCKWDHVLVLVSETGLKKSTLGRILAGDEDDRARTGNFSDQTILPLRPEKRAELVKGKWVYELSELAGITKASVEELRSFISRQVDEGRPAYGRFVEQQPRTCVFYGTTNEPGFIYSQTKDRRFWPVEMNHLDDEALRRDRDQLMAEAVMAEAQGERLFLDGELLEQMFERQEGRRVHDPWEDVIADLKGHLPRMR